MGGENMLNRPMVLERLDELHSVIMQQRGKAEGKDWYSWDGARQITEVLRQEVIDGKYDVEFVGIEPPNTKQAEGRKIIILEEEPG